MGIEEAARVAEKSELAVGLRSAVIDSYQVPRAFYERTSGSACRVISHLGCCIYYGLELGYMGRKKRIPMDVDALVKKWHKVIVGLAIAHDKDEADRFEAAIEECLTPILAAPIKQVREFYPKLLKRMKEDKTVPFLVWRSYEIWINGYVEKATDESIKQLKAGLAKEIADMVEADVKEQLPDALIRALQWRSEAALQEVKEAVVEAKAKGNKPRLRGRESCLFLEVGGTESEPKACIQI